MSLTVILDMDGTLVDNSYFHTVAWWYACRDHGIAMSMATIHRLIGMGADQMVPALVGRDMPELAEAQSRHYRGYLHDVPALPGAAQLLGELHRRGATIALATSGGRPDLDVLLARLETSPLLDRVITSADVTSSKPAPDLPLAALHATETDPQDAVFVGDTRWDVEAAGRAGISCVALRSGGWSEAELREAGAAEVHEDAAALLAALDESLIGRRLRDAAV